MPILPNSLALTTIGDGALVLASDHRNNYAAIQNAVNQLIGWGAEMTLANTYANRPAANTVSPGVLFFATDTQGVWRSDGAVWTLVSQGSPLITPAQMSVAPFTTPYDGQRIDLQVDASSGINWRFKYRAASGSSFRWEFLGGPPMNAIVTTGETNATTTGSYLDLATVGPRVVLPRAGDYDAIGGAGFMNTNAGGYFQLGICRNAGTAIGGNAIGNQQTASFWIELSFGARVPGCAAGDDIRLRYWFGTAGTNQAIYRWINVTPVRIS